jgi:hypothetical protein
VITCGNYDRIHVFRVEEFADVLISFGAAAAGLLRQPGTIREPLLVYVADRGDTTPRLGSKRRQKLAAAPSQAGDTDIHLVVGPRGPKTGDGRRRSTEKQSAIHALLRASRAA